MLQIHVINGAGVHGRRALAGRLRPRPSVWDKGPHGHGRRMIKALAQRRRKERDVGLEGGARWHGDPLLDLLRGGAAGGWHARPSLRRGVREGPRGQGIFAALQGAGCVCGGEVGAVRWRLGLVYGRGGYSKFWI